MIDRRGRSVFSLCLAFALLPLVSMAAGRRDARVQSVMAWMQLQARSQSEAQATRAGLEEFRADREPAPPFAPAAAFRLAQIGGTPSAPARAPHAFVVVSVAALHPARAPPAFL